MWIFRRWQNPKPTLKRENEALRAWGKSMVAELQAAHEESAKLAAQVDGARVANIALCQENAELRAMVIRLDSALMDVSSKLWGQQALDEAVARAKKNGSN